MQVFSAIIIVLFSLSAQAIGSYSQDLLELQAEFRDANPRHTIVYIDREIIQSRLKRHGLHKSEDKDQLARNQIIAEFVKERVGIQLDSFAADMIGDYYGTGIQVAVPLENKEFAQPVCAVLGADPETTAEDEAERFLYWEHMKGHTPEYEDVHYKVLFSKDQFAKMTDLHETFHCLDPYYITKQNTFEYEREITVHKAESFAEVGALLYLSQKGHNDWALDRSLYRIVGSLMVGRYGEELIGPNLFQGINFGVVYNFFPALFATQHVIDNGGATRLSLQDIIELAHAITEENAIESIQSQAISQHQANPEYLQTLIEEFKSDENDKLKQRFEAIEDFRDQYVEILAWAFPRLLQ